MSFNTRQYSVTSSDVKRQCASVRGIMLLSILTICDLKLLFILIYSSRSMDILHSKYQKFVVECCSIPGNIVQHQAV